MQILGIYFGLINPRVAFRSLPAPPPQLSAVTSLLRYKMADQINSNFQTPDAAKKCKFPANQNHPRKYFSEQSPIRIKS